MTTKFNSLIQVLDYFKDEATCIAYLAKERWGDTPACPHCGNVGAYVTNRGFKCKAKECHKKFSVTTGTTFENTKISLRTWFAAMYLCTAHKKGISSLQLSRDLNITQKTAWFILHRIREMLTIYNSEKLSGTVEVDETYVGGLTRNKSNKIRKELKEAGTQFSDKTGVVALVQRDGEIRTQVINTQKPSFNDIYPVIQNNTQPDAFILTDSAPLYKTLKNHYKHEFINHAQGEYVRGKMHTNTVEGFFSQLKRGIIGIFHQVSPKHLQRYCNEFGFKYNTRKLTDTERFNSVLKLTDNKRLTYTKLIS